MTLPINKNSLSLDRSKALENDLIAAYADGEIDETELATLETHLVRPWWQKLLGLPADSTEKTQKIDALVGAITEDGAIDNWDFTEGIAGNLTVFSKKDRAWLLNRIGMRPFESRLPQLRAILNDIAQNKFDQIEILAEALRHRPANFDLSDFQTTIQSSFPSLLQALAQASAKNDADTSFSDSIYSLLSVLPRPTLAEATLSLLNKAELNKADTPTADKIFYYNYLSGLDDRKADQWFLSQANVMSGEDNETTFQNQVLSSDLPVVAFSWMSRCQHCQALKSDLIALLDQYPGRFRIVAYYFSQTEIFYNQIGFTARSVPTTAVYGRNKPEDPLNQQRGTYWAGHTDSTKAEIEARLFPDAVK